MTKHYWAYAIAQDISVAVRCPDAETAEEEKERLKFSGARAVGRTRYAITEAEFLEACLLRRGLKIDHIRGPGSFRIGG